jgi:hypothetical protein
LELEPLESAAHRFLDVVANVSEFATDGFDERGIFFVIGIGELSDLARPHRRLGVSKFNF